MLTNVNDWFLLITVMLASAVEMVEATTIILAVGITRGWRSAFEGTAVALVALTAIVAILGPALVNYVPIDVLRLVVGFLLVVFGLQWLRKAILRATGYKSLHDEAAIYDREIQLLKQAPEAQKTKRDALAFTVSFKGVFLEGLEVIMIVISFGVPSGRLELASIGAAISVVVVGAAGFMLVKPLAGVPENSMKLGVGLMLTSFGAFWLGEGAGINWPGADLFILALLAVLGLVTFGLISYLKRSKVQPLSEVKA